jgi:hypothetical protein
MRVEQLQRYFHGRDSADEDQLKERLDSLEQKIRDSWDRYKRYQETMHDIKIETSALRMVLLWLLREGFIHE